MSAQREERRIAAGGVDAPISYVLTGRGWAAAEVAHPGTELVLSRKPTAAEARRLAGVRLRVVDARPPRYLPAEPLLRLVAARGGPAACGVRQHSPEDRALGRARESGRVTLRMGEHLAEQLLELTVREVWDAT